MRLTLRTLLAYLDNTLDSQDAEALKLKLSESSFATQLVQRIRDSLGNQMLAAPAPDAVGPVEDANAISEYLDSTLSTEQVSEIERACLESDPHLAEAAACHQILTMVLGKPANVSAELRQRIYELPDRSIEQIASGESFSSLAVPKEPSPVGPWGDDVPTADATLSPEQHVEPVGVADSGVSDAPTRLREMQVAEDPLSTSAATARTGPTIAGSKPRSITDAEIYGGSIRPSRITPWLVSLAIAAVLLFALSQIFAPLLARNKEVAEVKNGEIGTAETMGSVDQLSATDDVTPPAEDSNSAADPSAADPSAAEPSATTPQSPEESDVDPESPPPATTSTPDDPEDRAETPAAVADVDGVEATTDDSANDKLAAGDDEQPMTERPADPIETGPVSESEVSPPTDEDLAGTDPPIPPVADGDLPAEPAPEQPNSDNGVQVAKLTSSDSLIATMGDQQWMSFEQDAPINSESVLVCAPTFRAEMVSANQLLTTMIGPTRLSWRSDNGGNQLHLETGRVLLSAGEPESTISMLLAGQAIKINFAAAAHVAAVQVVHLRRPGFDPLVAENHIPVRVITAVQGTIAVSGAENDEADSGKLETGQQWLMYGNEEPTVTDLEQLPAWVEQPDDSDLTLEANARKGLLGLLSEGDQSLEIALREATSFRQSEVAALAGQTLLALRKGDVYFDAVGILNQPKQRAYWPDHFLALQTAIDEGVESASSLYGSIQRTNLANGDAIMRLLAGYSQQQLIDGGDQELVEMLDSTSMAVRVLALENLRRITGTTLYFRAEQDNAVRRTQGIKKWTTRQRKGDIRWPE